MLKKLIDRITRWRARWWLLIREFKCPVCGYRCVSKARLEAR
jgi:transcription elongation factor Elf1